MISIIILTLNEERSLPSLLDAICQQGADHEVIVVDGGSQDRTLEIAGCHGVRTLASPPGRGNGICVGAKAARGDVLFFLHADSTLPPGALDRINEVLAADAQVVGGNFRLVFDGDTTFSRWVTGFYAWIRSIGLYYGDSGIFVRRSVYEALGGFRPIPLMEDLDFVRRIERFGRTCCIKDRGGSRSVVLLRSSAARSRYMRCSGSAHLQTGWLKSIVRRRRHRRSSGARSGSESPAKGRCAIQIDGGSTGCPDPGCKP